MRGDEPNLQFLLLLPLLRPCRVVELFQGATTCVLCGVYEVIRLMSDKLISCYCFQRRLINCPAGTSPSFSLFLLFSLSLSLFILSETQVASQGAASLTLFKEQHSRKNAAGHTKYFHLCRADENCFKCLPCIGP